MGSSGIIFVVIVALWAAYLVPQWLRRREQLSVTQSVGRSSEAVRVLMRRAQVRRDTSRPSTRPAVEQPVLVVRPEHPATRMAEPVASQRVGAPRRAAAIAARRRQRVLATLVGLTVLVWTVTSVAAAPVALAVAPTLLLVAFVASLVVSGHQRLRGARGPAVAAEAGRGDRLAQAARRIEHRVLDRLRTEEAAVVPEVVVAEPEVAVDVAAPVEAPVDGSWVPVPVPQPTYMLKPAAPRRLVKPYVDPEAPPAAASQDEDRVIDAREYDIDRVLERRRAAGE